MIKTIKFKYDKKEDKKVWRRYNNFVAKNKMIWGRKIPNIKQIISVNQADFDIDVKEITSAYDKVFDMSVAKINGYIATTPFSMIDDDGKFNKKESNLYYSIYNNCPVSIVIGHEIFHIYFEKYSERKIPNYDEAKEYFTVIMNDIFGNGVSKGYPEHQEIRDKILKIWLKTHSIDECIKVVQLARD
ncbi:MAG: hypothetical protein L6275_00645 [Candidatus Portnoybacteria bacterium]|nr:hypothetical protein [Candidatus Portnoybacteria bacterium]